DGIRDFHVTGVQTCALPIFSSGTLLAAVGLGAVPATAAAIYYMVASTLGIAALYLLIELIERARTPGANVLAVTADFFGQRSDRSEERRVGKGGRTEL